MLEEVSIIRLPLGRQEDQSTYNVRRKNWPPWPEQCCFKPCFYQDIQVDIRLEFRKIMCYLYQLWIFHEIIMILNVLGGIVIVDYTVIGWGIWYMILYPPFAYLCWFRPAYNAFRSDSSFNFMVFFFIFFFQFVVSVIQAIGILNSGTIGIITALTKFKVSDTAGGIVAAVFELLIAIAFGCAAAADLFLIIKIYRMYRSTGSSFAKAQAEFRTEFLRNQHVRSAASNVAATAVQSQCTSNTTDNRY